MFRTASLLVLVAGALAGQVVAASPAPVSGKVVSVHEGHALTVRADAGEPLKVRLHGVDTPEIGQAFGGTIPRESHRDCEGEAGVGRAGRQGQARASGGPCPRR